MKSHTCVKDVENLGVIMETNNYIDELINKSLLTQDSIESNFKLYPNSKQQNYRKGYIEINYELHCTSLSIIISGSDLLLIQLKILLGMDEEQKRYLEKVIPFNELIPNIEFFLAIDDACIKAEKGILSIPKDQPSLLSNFRVSPYKKEEE
jgi:hypothetical protein